MKKRFFVTLLCLLVVLSACFAADNWYDGLKLKSYDVKGLQNIESSKFFDVINKYLEKEFTKELYSKIEKELYLINGVDYISATVSDNVSPSGVKLILTVKELPQIKAITYVGNNVAKSYELNNSLTTLKIGNYIDPSKKLSAEMAINELKEVYLSKGFDETPVSLDYTIDEKTNKVTLNFTVIEGQQSRILAIAFEGNNNLDDASLKKVVTTKLKGLFNNGYLDYEKINDDKLNIISLYNTLGYIDSSIKDVRIDELTDLSTSNYRAVKVTFVIDEGICWKFGGINIKGNQVFSSEEISSYITHKVGSSLNLVDLQTQISSIADLYYDNGYITCNVDVQEDRNELDKTITFNLSLTEGTQAVIEDIIIEGLTKTKEYVMTRELELKKGDIFSKSKLITSAQNLYNTGLLTNLDYDIQFGSSADKIVIVFNVEEGNQMDIQFGATFGGTITGFPISGFLQWGNHNFLGKGQDINISTNVSPDSQSLSFTFGDNWVKNHRWANSVSFSFNHTKYKNEYQKATGNMPYYNGRNKNETYPLGTTSSYNWINKIETPDPKYLMDYDLFTGSLAYQTGYTFIFNSGRLSIDGGLSFSLNRATFNENYIPFESLIAKYGEKWQFSNRLSTSLTWDGRDYVYNPTKGYVVSASATYAGGVIGGLSNYIKLNASASGYLKVFSFSKEDEKHNLMLCATSNASIMLPQYYNNEEDLENSGWGFHNPRLGATEYEMLYIDGMTTARGHEPNLDNVFMWDNIVELGYPIVENILQAETFVSGTALCNDYSEFKNGLNWYFSAGAGLKLKLSGFPLGLYIVKNATYDNVNHFKFMSGPILHNDNRPDSGLKFVLAISTSLI